MQLKSFFPVIILSVSFLFSCQPEDNKSNRIKRIYSQQESGTSKGTREFRFSYDNQGRVLSLEEVSLVKVGSSEQCYTLTYHYDYHADSLLIWRTDSYSELVGSTGYPVSSDDDLHRDRYVASLDGEGRVDTLWASTGAYGVAFAYDTRGYLSSTSVFDSLRVGMSTTSVYWDKDGVLKQIVADRNSIGVDYSEAPLDNNFEVDLVLMYLEQLLIQDIPLWGLGLQGKTSPYLPQRIETAEAGQSVSFVYSTDGERITGVKMQYPDKEYSWVIEYVD